MNTGWTAGRVVTVVVGAVLAVIGLALLGAGAVALWTVYVDDGYLDLGARDEPYRSSGYAVTSEGWHVSEGAAALLGTARVRVTPTDDAPVFVGIAPESDVRRYLDGVRHTAVEVGDQGRRTDLTYGGGAPQLPPQEVEFWIVQAAGSGPRTVTWTVEPGAYALVVMNADGTSGVSGRVTVAVTLPMLPWVAAGVMVGAVLILTASVVLLLVAIRRAAGNTAA